MRQQIPQHPLFVPEMMFRFRAGNSIQTLESVVPVDATRRLQVVLRFSGTGVAKSGHHSKRHQRRSSGEDHRNDGHDHSTRAVLPDSEEDSTTSKRFDDFFFGSSRLSPRFQIGTQLGQLRFKIDGASHSRIAFSAPIIWR